jgi:hypothetical protein
VYVQPLLLAREEEESERTVAEDSRAHRRIVRSAGRATPTRQGPFQRRRAGPIARPTSGAHDHRLLTFRSGNLKLTPAAGPSGKLRADVALDLSQIFAGWHLPVNIEPPRSSTLREPKARPVAFVL